MSISFTQFLRPDGRKRSVDIERPDEIEAAARVFVKKGGWFECEELTTGHVSLTACALVDDEPGDIAIEVCENGPAVEAAVDRLVKKALSTLMELQQPD